MGFVLSSGCIFSLLLLFFLVGASKKKICTFIYRSIGQHASSFCRKPFVTHTYGDPFAGIKDEIRNRKQ